jgi:hypothetical protein
MAKKKSAKKTAKKAAKKKPAAMKGKARTKKAAPKKSMGKKKAAKKTAVKKSRPKARKRELINTGTDKRFVRRDEAGQFKDVVDVSRSLAADIRQHAETAAGPGQGDRGD